MSSLCICTVAPKQYSVDSTAHMSNDQGITHGPIQHRTRPSKQVGLTDAGLHYLGNGSPLITVHVDVIPIDGRHFVQQQSGRG